MSTRGFNLFPGIIFAFIALNMCVVGVTVYLATSDQSAAIEPDYYRKAVEWDTIARQREHNAKLGWSVNIDTEASGAPGVATLTIRLVDGGGEPVAGGKLHVVAFASARAVDRVELDLVEGAAGVYAAPMRVGTGGLWEFALTASARHEVFTSSVSQDVAIPTGAPPSTRGGA